MLRRPAALRDLPEGPPLSLELPGRALELLSPFVRPERIARMESALAARTAHLVPVLEHLHDPHNVGACLRTMDALGIHEVHVIRQPAPPPPPGQWPEPLKLGRDITRGCEKWLELHVTDDAAATFAELAARGFRIAVTDIHGDRPAYSPLDVPLDRPLAVVFGNEHEGVSEAARAAADCRLLMPMHGFVESLNVSVATALIMARLRERVDDEVSAATRGLAAERLVRTLDAWICNEIPRLRAVLRELAARHEAGSEDG
jgi:tRNA (guanosine-2'-O-)-methyltransferase